MSHDQSHDSSDSFVIKTTSTSELPTITSTPRKISKYDGKFIKKEREREKEKEAVQEKYQNMMLCLLRERERERERKKERKKEAVYICLFGKSLGVGVNSLLFSDSVAKCRVHLGIIELIASLACEN